MTTSSRSVLVSPRRSAARLLAALATLALVILPGVAFSADTVIGTVPVGDSPTAIAVDPVTHHVYVANFYGDSVTVVNGVTHAVEATVPMPTGGTGGFPIAVVADPLTGRAYAGTFWSDYVSVIGPGHSAVATISPPPSHGSGVRALALDPAGPTTKLYAAILGKDLVSVIDASTDSVVANIPVGRGPRALAVFSSGARRRVYVANRYTNDVSIIDGTTDSVVATVPTGAGPKVIAVDPDRGFAYVSSPASDTVTVIDDTDAATATIAVGDNPIGVAVDAVRRRVFVTAYNEARVTVIDADTLAVVGTVETGVQPYAVAVDQSAGRVFVSCYGGDLVTAIDAATLVPVDVPVGYRPYALGIDEGLAVHKTFVGNWGSDDVSVVDPAEGVDGPVSASVDALPGDRTATPSPELTGAAASTRAPWPSAVVAVFYRLDGDPVWKRATLTQGAGTPDVRWRTEGVGPLADGPHTIEVAAMDQATAAASSSDQGSGGASASLGAPSSYTFTVGAAPPTPPSTVLTVVPADPDGLAGWYLTPPRVTLTPDAEVQTYYGWDGSAEYPYAGPFDAPPGVHTLWYRSGDAARGFEDTRSATFACDPVVPSGPVLTAVSHVPGEWSRHPDVVVGLSGAHDADSGIAGFSAVWSDFADAVPDETPGLDPLTSSVATRLAEGSWYLAVRPRDVAGNEGGIVRSGPYRIDLTPPVTDDDAVPLYHGIATVTLSAEDTLSGSPVTSYRLDGGPWTEGTVVTAGAGPHELEYRSVDGAGNVEDTRSVAFTVFVRHEENDPALVRRGRWSVGLDSRYSAGSAIRCDKRGAYVDVAFDGSSLDLVAATGPDFGIARVSVDGGPGVPVNLYSPSPAFQVTAWRVSGMARGRHVVRIESTGTRARTSKGTVVVIDAFDVDGPLVPGQ